MLAKNKSTLPIFNQPDLRQDLEMYLDIVTDYTQQTKASLKNISQHKPVVQMRLGANKNSHIQSNSTTESHFDCGLSTILQ